MFRSSIKLFKIFGIEVRLDYSWFIIFALFAYYIGFYYLPSVIPDINIGILIIVTLLTVILLFFSVLFHEMSHSLIARRFGIPINRISLFIFGGMAQIEKEADTPGAEFLMAIAGPVASFFLAIVFGIIWAFTLDIPLIGEPARYLTIINIVLGVFNLLPGYPLDGGRVLRSIIWKATNNMRKATFVAAIVGRVIGFGIIGLGVYFLFTGNFLNGVWLAFIGWFLQSSAWMGYRQLVFETSIKGMKVKDVMNEDLITVPKDINLEDLVNHYFMKHRYGRFPVVEDDYGEDFIGVISLHDIKAFPKEKWQEILVEDIVKSYTEDEVVDKDTELSDAIRKMTSKNLGHLVVISGSKIIGIITKSDVMQFIKLQTELH